MDGLEKLRPAPWCFYFVRLRFPMVNPSRLLAVINDYYRATRTKPDGAVGGEWPEPAPPQ